MARSGIVSGRLARRSQGGVLRRLALLAGVSAAALSFAGGARAQDTGVYQPWAEFGLTTDFDHGGGRGQAWFPLTQTPGSVTYGYISGNGLIDGPAPAATAAARRPRRSPPAYCRTAPRASSSSRARRSAR